MLKKSLELKNYFENYCLNNLSNKNEVIAFNMLAPINIFSNFSLKKQKEGAKNVGKNI